MSKTSDEEMISDRTTGEEIQEADSLMRRRESETVQKESERRRHRGGDDVKWRTRKRLVGAAKIKEITHPKAWMSENGDQFNVDGRKPGSTCKLHSVSRSGAETMPAP